MKIYMNHLSWNVGKSTDVKVRETFKILEGIYPDINFYYPHSKLQSLLPNIKRVILGILRRFSCIEVRYDYLLKFEKLANIKEFRKGTYDIVYTQGNFPKNIPFDTPVFFDSFLIEPEQTEACYDEKSQEYFELTKERLGIIANRKCLINLRSDYSVNLAKKLYPSVSEKFVNIPFLLPSLKAISDEKLINKHNNDAIIKILFTGAQAKRKGLDLLINALNSLYDRGYKKWELIVVSSMDDGKIDIPNFLPIRLMGELAYNDVLKLAKECHFYAMISLSESFGLSYIEAEANGCIPLARDFEPQREIVDYGRVGFLAKPSVSDISAKLEIMFEMSRDERIEMALEAKKYFLRNYEFSIVANLWYDAFVKIEKMI